MTVAEAREPLEIKPFTSYECRTEGCRARSSMWTGAMSAPRRPGDGYCSGCGEPMAEVVDDGRRWRVRYEQVPLYGSDWRESFVEHPSEQSARNQLEGLVELMEAGELVRRPVIEVAEIVWRPM